MERKKHGEKIIWSGQRDDIPSQKPLMEVLSWLGGRRVGSLYKTSVYRETRPRECRWCLLAIAACNPRSHSPCSSIHRLTYTLTPPCHRTGSRKHWFQPSIPPLLLFSPLPSSLFNLSHSHAALSPPTLLAASSLCQVTALNTRHLTLSLSVPLSSRSLDFLSSYQRFINVSEAFVDSHHDLLCFSSPRVPEGEGVCVLFFRGGVEEGRLPVGSCVLSTVCLFFYGTEEFRLMKQISEPPPHRGNSSRRR